MSKNFQHHNREHHRMPHITHPSSSNHESHHTPAPSHAPAQPHTTPHHVPTHPHTNNHPHTAHHPHANHDAPAQHNPTAPSLQEHEYFVCLNEPAVFRRNLLEASKGSLVVIKGLYVIREIKARKQEKLTQLQKEIREIRLLMQKAEEFLPKHSKHDAARLFPQAAEKKQVAPQVKQPAPERPHIQVVPMHPVSEMDNLSHSIKEIESKLNSLPGKKEAPVITPAKEEPKSEAANDLTAELGKTLEGIQKRLRQM
jgi:hypothetical protein